MHDRTHDRTNTRTHARPHASMRRRTTAPVLDFAVKLDEQL
jgi:hypothetical protein